MSNSRPLPTGEGFTGEIIIADMATRAQLKSFLFNVSWKIIRKIFSFVGYLLPHYVR